MWTKAKLEALTREQLVGVASSMCIPPAGEPDSVLIYEILFRQGELAGRATDPVEVRLMRLEDSVVNLQNHVARLGRLAAELTYVLHGTGVKVSQAALDDAEHFRRLAKTRGE